jgi:hypothetical protein
MNTLTDNSGAHALDGTDPDAPRNRRIGGKDWEWCRQAAEDFRELEAMTESDKRHYSATLGGSRGNSISRGR